MDHYWYHAKRIKLIKIKGYYYGLLIHHTSSIRALLKNASASLNEAFLEDI